MNKPYLSIEDSINKIKNKKITIDELKYKEVLSKISLNKIYSPYKRVLGVEKDELSCHIYEGIDFVDFELLYLLDKKCTSIVFELFGEIETYIKTTLINVLGDKYCADGKSDFLEVTNEICLNSTKKNKEKELAKNCEKVLSLCIKSRFTLDYRFKFISLDEKIIFKDSEIKHHYNNYQSFPIWLFINKMTLGNITYLIKYIEPEVSDSISKSLNRNYDKVTNKLTTNLDNLRKYRNTFAHNYTLATIMDTDLRNPSLNQIISIIDTFAPEKAVEFNNMMRMEVNKHEYINTLNKIQKNDSTILNQIINKYFIAN